MPEQEPRLGDVPAGHEPEFGGGARQQFLGGDAALVGPEQPRLEFGELFADHPRVRVPPDHHDAVAACLKAEVEPVMVRADPLGELDRGLVGVRPAHHVAHVCGEWLREGAPEGRRFFGELQHGAGALVGIDDHARRIRDGDDIVDVVNRVDEGGLPQCGHGTFPW